MNNNKKGCGCFKYLLIAIAVIVVIARFAGGNDSTSSTGGNTSSGTTDTTVTVESTRFYYQQLSGIEKAVYHTLVENAKDGTLKYTVAGIDYDDYVNALERTVSAFVYDHPELFWLSGAWSANGTRGSGVNNDTITISLGTYAFWDYVSKPQKYIDTFEAAANAIAAKAQTYTNVYDQVEFVHDYVAYNCYYDNDNLAEAKKTYHIASSEYIYSAYGCIVNKAAVCAGYARSFQTVMQRLGYTCAYVRGDAGGSHAWNYVVLDDEGYFLDVTWDDADYRTDSGAVRFPNDAEYDYFCITKRELNKTHTEDESVFNIPDPTATKYNYYRYNGYLVNTYNFAQVKTILDAQANKSVVSIQFASLAELEKAKKDLFENGNFRNVPSFANKKISYVTDKDHLSFTILKD